MTTRSVRPKGCLSPIRVDEVTRNPHELRALARRSGPYFMPARYLVDGGSAASARDGSRKRTKPVPAHLIGPVWRGDWAFNGDLLVPEAEPYLNHQGFIDAAKQMYDADVVVPEQVYVNLTSPMSGNSFSHVDIPEFVGFDRNNVPGWFLQAMGTSRLFEEMRITIVTAVAWFFEGERGYFRYWPNGRDADSVRHEAMWNTAVVGDNDFMHHKVERVGPADMGAPADMTIDTMLDHDGDNWVVTEDDNVLARYDDEHLRLSLSWKAKVYADVATQERATQGEGAITLDDALARFAGALDQPLAATGAEALSSPALRDQFSSTWNGYVPD